VFQKRPISSLSINRSYLSLYLHLLVELKLLQSQTCPTIQSIFQVSQHLLVSCDKDAYSLSQPQNFCALECIELGSHTPPFPNHTTLSPQRTFTPQKCGHHICYVIPKTFPLPVLLVLYNSALAPSQKTIKTCLTLHSDDTPTSIFTPQL
jgi:hypothetical protein